MNKFDYTKIFHTLIHIRYQNLALMILKRIGEIKWMDETILLLLFG
ncbi:unnamed protein product [Fructobacillus tropaeoli]|nr:unnamed protein product [Fructobacillus tropaeoli]